MSVLVMRQSTGEGFTNFSVGIAASYFPDNTYQPASSELSQAHMWISSETGFVGYDVSQLFTVKIQ